MIKVKQSNFTYVYHFDKNKIRMMFSGGFLYALSRGESTILIYDDDTATHTLMCKEDEPDYLFYLLKYCEQQEWEAFLPADDRLKLYLFCLKMGIPELLPELRQQDQQCVIL